MFGFVTCPICCVNAFLTTHLHTQQINIKTNEACKTIKTCMENMNILLQYTFLHSPFQKHMPSYTLFTESYKITRKEEVKEFVK